MVLDDLFEHKQYRAPTPNESAVLQRLLEEEFAGAAQLRKQLEGLMVRIIDDEGSLDLNVKTKTSANVTCSVPVEAFYSDVDNDDPFACKVRILLHVKNGFLHELEIYKDDGSEILKPPTYKTLQVMVDEYDHRAATNSGMGDND